MKNNKGFTLIELLAVIVVLAIVMVLATTTVLPYMSDARQNAFKIEASNVISAVDNAKDLYNIGKIKMNSNAKISCATATKICFNVDELINLGIYEGDKNSYDGKITVANYNTPTPTYELYLKKNDEFKILGGTLKDYTNASLSTGDWAASYTECSCS